MWKSRSFSVYFGRFQTTKMLVIHYHRDESETVQCFERFQTFLDCLVAAVKSVWEGWVEVDVKSSENHFFKKFETDKSSKRRLWHSFYLMRHRYPLLLWFLRTIRADLFLYYPILSMRDNEVLKDLSKDFWRWKWLKLPTSQTAIFVQFFLCTIFTK